jgi:hypothetical protein
MTSASACFFSSALAPFERNWYSLLLRSPLLNFVPVSWTKTADLKVVAQMLMSLQLISHGPTK